MTEDRDSDGDLDFFEVINLVVVVIASVAAVVAFFALYWPPG